jgi:hypothetical protein
MHLMIPLERRPSDTAGEFTASSMNFKLTIGHYALVINGQEKIFLLLTVNGQWRMGNG